MSAEAPKQDGSGPGGAVRMDDMSDEERAMERAILRQVAEIRPKRSAEERAARVAARAERKERTSSPEERRARRNARLGVTPAAGGAPREKKPELPLERVYEDDDLVVSRMGDPAAPRVVLCFSGIGVNRDNRHKSKLAMGGIQPAEFVGTSQLEDSSVIHIADIGRTWFNGFEPERLLSIIEPLTDGKPVVSLGNSMGGFGAIWVTKFLPVETAIAFVPQFSVHPKIMPRERRWKQFTSRIETWRTESLAESFNQSTRYYTFNGDRDHHHWRRFRPAANIDHYVLIGAAHQAAEKMKAAGVLGEVIRACVAHDDPLPIMERAGLDVRKLGA